ncbi:MAG: hypoxanthine phosphoribosyltransferase [Lachnospiraceae bacterium]|nr:hypoxanthine phosphoribosyltransferase [Lachnospiraceae bacterium]MBP5249710.1 hypoxanthine phosphoribosyltransferase [Lachnospiraceae bacterium]
MEGKVTVLISEEDVEKRITELAGEISRDYAGKEVLFVCILKGSIFFTTALAKHMSVPVTFDFMSVSSYGDATVSSGRVKIIKDLDDSIEGKDVIVIEDIIDSGRTLDHLVRLLEVRKPNSIKLCTLLDKPDRREIDVKVDYVGFTIPDAFVVGYGLDYKQHYRNLPYVGVLHLNED